MLNRQDPFTVHMVNFELISLFIYVCVLYVDVCIYIYICVYETGYTYDIRRKFGLKNFNFFNLDKLVITL